MLNSEHDNIIASAYLQVINNIAKSNKIIVESKEKPVMKVKAKIKTKIAEAGNKQPDKDSSLNLINACSDGDLNRVITLLKEGANINLIENSTQKTPIEAAITNNHIEIVQYLINKGVNLLMVDENNVSPLMLACNLGYFPIIQLLLEQPDINVNVQENYTGYTALMIVLDSNILEVSEKEELVKMLISKNANLNIQDEQYGLTALDRTNTSEMEDIKRLLISHNGMSSEELDKIK